MKIDENSQVPIFIQIANALEDQILKEVYQEDDRIPSTNELAQYLQINPHTVLKGMNLLVDEGLLYKKRGVGMFVTKDALSMIREKRIRKFQEEFIQPLIQESQTLGLTLGEIQKMIQHEIDKGE
ncbi:MAG: GntR family transcriptional regulator [Tissierellia bacterium]|nr:GntR family transcriptional regulator [Tissierellia bacterium]